MINVNWDNIHRTVIRFNFSGNWSLGEFREAIRKANRMLDKINHKADYIYDMSECDLPHRLSLTNMQKMVNITRHPNLRRLVIIERGACLQMFLDIIDTLFPKTTERSYPVSFTRSLTRARNLLAAV